mmetsp:Transcript_31532/g.50306  ORF Transcript_31532/g.50306 Transcript_31532/m.50306 type:complete len:105 (-) Transcript_31532:13-327(-)
MVCSSFLFGLRAGLAAICLYIHVYKFLSIACFCWLGFQIAVPSLYISSLGCRSCEAWMSLNNYATYVHCVSAQCSGSDKCFDMLFCQSSEEPQKVRLVIPSMGL